MFCLSAAQLNGTVHVRAHTRKYTRGDTHTHTQTHTQMRTNANSACEKGGGVGARPVGSCLTLTSPLL